MERTKMTPKDFFLWAGAMITLYASVFAFLALLFDYINYTFPDPLRYYADPYASSIPYAMASLIVLTPVFLLLMRIIRRAIVADASRAEIWVRRWALYLTVFAAAATIVVDLIVLLTAFLRGEEITAAFLFKVLVVLLVAGAGFMHFLADLWGFWVRQPGQARLVNYSTGLLVVITIIAGFFIVGTPGQARLARLDDQKVSDLTSIQYQVVNYWQQKQRLPVSLTELNDPLSSYSAPTDPQSGQDYGYRITTPPYSFEVCANFNLESRETIVNGRTIPKPTYPAGDALYVGGSFDTWQHVGGGVQTCFERTIDSERYPPLNK